MEQTFSNLPQWLKMKQSDHMDSPIKPIITGEIPEWIRGSLYRNGSGLYKVGPTVMNHIFDGFAVLQRWTFKDGHVTYQSSLLDTEDYKKAAAQNKLTGLYFGSRFPDPCQTIFGRLFCWFLPDGDVPMNMDNTAVNIVESGDSLFAVSDITCVNEVEPSSLTVKVKSKISDLVDLHVGCSHPHTLKDGTLIYLGTNMNYKRAFNFISIPPQRSTSKVPFSGAKVVATVPSRWKLNISYVHSFGITENYFVLTEQPFTANLPRFMLMPITGSTPSECMVTHDREPLDITLIQRSTGERIPVTFQAPTGFVFHVINCYEESGHVICDFCYYPGGADIVKQEYLDRLAQSLGGNKTEENRVFATFSRFVLPLDLDGAKEGTDLVKIPNTTATATLQTSKPTVVALTPETIEGSPTTELPRINYEYNGAKYRYFYSTSTGYAPKQELTKFDVVEKSVLSYKVTDFRPGEPVFLARPGATEEDDGVVLATIAACKPGQQSYLVVLDAKTFTEIARASLPAEHTMSVTFHGTFTDRFL